MKKVFSMALVAVMMVVMGVTAFAEESASPELPALDPAIIDMIIDFIGEFLRALGEIIGIIFKF